MKRQFPPNLIDIKAKHQEMGSFQKNLRLAKLNNYGVTDFNQFLYNEVMDKTLTNYPDYKDNEEDYNSFSKLSEVKAEAYVQALNDNLYELDEDNNVVMGAGAPSWQKFGLLDKSALKGFLLAEKNGFTSDRFDDTYTQMAMKERKRLEDIEIEGTVLNDITGLVGTLGGIVGDEFLPAEIIATIPAARATTIAKAAGKAFAMEASVASITATARSFRKRRHKDHMTNEIYTTGDMVKEIAIDTAVAGLVRGLGSIVADNYTLWRGVKDIKNQADKDIVTNYIKEKQYALTPDTKTSNQILAKVASDIEDGKNVDIADFTTVDINTRVDPNIKPVDFKEQLAKEYQARGYDVDEQKFNDVINAPAVKDDIYDGMASNEDGDALNLEFAESLKLDEDVIALKKLEDEISSDGATPEEIIAMEESLPKTQGFQSQTMTIGEETINKTDFDLIQKRISTKKFNRDNPDNKKQITKKQEEAYKKHENIADELLDMDFKAGDSVPLFGAAATVGITSKEEENN